VKKKKGLWQFVIYVLFVVPCRVMVIWDVRCSSVWLKEVNLLSVELDSRVVGVLLCWRSVSCLC